MAMKFKLNRTKQCAKCPWKVSTNPHDIPNGYCEVKHANLSSTIANEGEFKPVKNLQVMACHHSVEGNEDYCIGWLNHQLGIGNNIMLRLKMMHCENAGDIKVYGEQHKTFKDTLPK